MVRRRSVLTGLGGGALVAAFAGRAATPDAGSPNAPKDTVAVLGTGQLGGTIGKRIANLGYPLIYGSRTPDGEQTEAVLKGSGPRASAGSLKDAAFRADIVVFALPWEPAKDLIPTLGNLSGKVIVDPMNWKFKIVDHYPYRPDPASSIAEQLQLLLPGAHVVKAFNTISFKNLADPARAGGPISIPIAGSDAGAKDKVARLISQLGLDAVDTGPLIAARYIEDLLLLEIGCAMYNKGPVFEPYLRRVPA
jgi:hypothetical protein